MSRRHLAYSITSMTLLASCTAPPPAPAKPSPAEVLEAAPPVAKAPILPPLTMDAYKKSVAERIARSSPDVFAEPLPEMFKSIVVLDITIDREGRLAQVTVRRSNGYKGLEHRAMESVKNAGMFGAPAFTVRARDGSVNFLETFLFRDDGRFQIRSLVE